MTSITIRGINLGNLREAVKLKVADSQVNFVASNVESIAWSRYVPNLMPKGIYEGDTMVGFAHYGSWGDDKPDMWGIARFMIGEQYQGKGYGKAAMREIIRLIKEQDPQTKGITLSYVPANDVARNLYARVGFRETGENWGDEIIAQYDYPSGHDNESRMSVKAESPALA
jgi:diamine N-acetyltransferase